MFWFGSTLSAAVGVSDLPAKLEAGWCVATGVAGCCTASEGVADDCGAASADDCLGSTGADTTGAVVASLPARKHSCRSKFTIDRM